MDEARMLELSADELEAEIRRHNDLYWLDAAPEISDALYDVMVERLRRLRPESAVLTDVGAGEAEVEATSDGKKVVHEHPMLSLDKCYTEEELLTWFGRFEGRALATHKIDGVAMSLRYDRDGNLDLGATRGNGRVGEDITENCRRVHDVPARVPTAGLEVRGEVYMPLSVFNPRYSDQFANPRNLTAGAIKLKDPAKTAEYDLRFFAYDALGLDDAATETDKRERLTQMGFVPSPGTVCAADTAQQTFESLAAHREDLDFETDGIVFKVDDVAQHAEMGMTAHHPRWAIAYKYQGESGFSQLKDIEWSVSRSGSINPVAHIEPVFLSGVTVSRVSLHNLAIIEKLAGGPLSIGENEGLALSAGARVLVTRRGGVIPHIEQVAEPGTGVVVVPDVCPSCGGATERHADFLMASHEKGCATQGIRSLEHFVKTIDIQGFGPKVLEQLWDRGMVRTPADLYDLQPEQLEDLDRLGRKSAQNLIDQVAAHTTVGLADLLAALGIPDLGGQIARLIEAAYVAEPDGAEDITTEAAQGALFAPSEPPRWDALAEIRAAAPDDLAEIDGIGPIVSAKIVDGLAERAELLDALLARVRVEVPERVELPTAGDNAVAGKSFVFTGAMETMSRDEAQRRVTELGGTTPSGVSGALDYLVLGDRDFGRFQSGWRSSKLKKAEAVQAKPDSSLAIISESEFLELLGD